MNNKFWISSILFSILQIYQEVRSDENCLFSLYSLQCENVTNTYYEQFLRTGYDEELKIIKCRWCHLQTLEEYMFSKNPKWSLNLRTIEITDNVENLKLIDTPFRGLDSLEWLKLYNSNIAEITSNTFEGVSNLKYLFLQNNSIQQLPARVFSEIENVIKINLNNNQIRVIHKSAFRGLQHLKELQLAGNQITRLKDGTFRHLSSIQAIDLSDNPLQTLQFELIHNYIPTVEILKIQNLPCTTLAQILLESVRKYYDLKTYTDHCQFTKGNCLFVKTIRQTDQKSLIISIIKHVKSDVIDLDKIGDIPCKRSQKT